MCRSFKADETLIELLGIYTQDFTLIIEKYLKKGLGQMLIGETRTLRRTVAYTMGY